MWRPCPGSLPETRNLGLYEWPEADFANYLHLRSDGIMASMEFLLSIAAIWGFWAFSGFFLRHELVRRGDERFGRAMLLVFGAAAVILLAINYLSPLPDPLLIAVGTAVLTPLSGAACIGLWLHVVHQSHPGRISMRSVVWSSGAATIASLLVLFFFALGAAGP